MTTHLNHPEDSREGFWDGDTGSLALTSRRALVQLIKGPLITYDKHPELWNAILSDTAALKSRLADIFLDLVVDEDSGIAFTRMVPAPEDLKIPQVLRTETLSHADTVVLLYLRSELALAPPGERVIIDVADIHEAASPYRSSFSRDESGFAKRINASVNRMKTFSLLSNTETEERLVISPVLRSLFDPETVSTIKAEYERFRPGADAPSDESDHEPDKTMSQTRKRSD